MAGDRLSLLFVHAHPDDESSKGPGTVAKYHAEGVETVLVCCTGGEQGDILNPAMDRPDVRDNLHEIRLQELKEATQIIGYDHVEFLGYRDSGMAGDESNLDPRCFAQAEHDEAVGRLVTLIRKHRPDVVLTYGDEQTMYPHPDHLRVHDVTLPAVDAARDAGAYPEAGEPWSVKKLYYSMWSLRKIRVIQDLLLSLGVESPFPSDLSAFPDPEGRITTRINVADFRDVKANALRAHATQIDPESPIWFNHPPDVDREMNTYDEYVLAESLIPVDVPEDDLFAGLRGT